MPDESMKDEFQTEQNVQQEAGADKIVPKRGRPVSKPASQQPKDKEADAQQAAAQKFQEEYSKFVLTLPRKHAHFMTATGLRDGYLLLSYLDIANSADNAWVLDQNAQAELINLAANLQAQKKAQTQKQ